jgi:predicted ATPase/class 3 adenylate cyclase
MGVFLSDFEKKVVAMGGRGNQSREQLIEPLTRRESQILTLLEQDLSTKEIAQRLSLAISSVKWHFQQIYGKLGVNNRRQALGRARELGLLQSGSAAPAAASAAEHEPEQRLPTGTVTFLFTDIEGSTPLWERQPEKMAEALQIHNFALRGAIEANGGAVFHIVGDSFQAVFATASQALKAVIEGQRALHSASWNTLGELEVRMGLHTGEAELDPGGNEYAVSHTKNRVARIMSAAHGGQILLSQETKDLVDHQLPEGVMLKDLGEQRLKGLSLPEHLYQACAPGMLQDFPPLVSRIDRQHNLPIQLTSFIGREKEIGELAGLLEQHHLVTLTGPGGVGKSRLSQEVAARVTADYSDGVWYIELAPLADAGLVAHTVAYTLGLRDAPGSSIQEILISFLSNRKALLILDNCEHLIDACASLADSVMHHCPKIRLLASSREALGVSGEMAFRVPSLSWPDPDHLPPLEELTASESVRLFVERAQLSLLGFRLTPENAGYVARVCQRLDGIPLAIELACARLGVLNVAQVAARLDDAFRLLTGGSRRALPRHQTLRATIDWSYQLLSEKESRLLRQLAIFAGGWTLDAAESICSGADLRRDEILDLLTSLVGKSLIIVDREQGQEARFRFLETVHQYAAEKLREEDTHLLRTRHRDYYLRLAETAGNKAMSAARLDWTRWLIHEHENLRLALDWSFHECMEVEAGLRIAVGISLYMQSLGYLGEHIDWLLAGLEGCVHSPISPLLRVQALNTLGNFLAMTGYNSAGRGKLETSVAACRELGSAAAAELSTALLGLGMCISGEDANLTRSLLEESVAIARGLGPGKESYLADVILYKTWLYLSVLNERENLLHDAQESYTLYLQIGARWDCAGPLIILGKFAFEQRDFELARRHFEEALALWEEAYDRWGVMLAHLNIGLFYSDIGDYDQSRLHFREYLRLRTMIGSRLRTGINNLVMLASLEVRQSQHSPVERQNIYLQRAATLFGAIEKLRGGQSIFDRWYTLENYTRELEIILSYLEQADLAQAWSAGQAMSFEGVWAYANEIYG